MIHTLCGVVLQDYIELLMPSLIQKWNTLKDDDKDLFPLLEVPHTLLHVLLIILNFSVVSVFCGHCSPVWFSAIL